MRNGHRINPKTFQWYFMQCSGKFRKIADFFLKSFKRLSSNIAERILLYFSLGFYKNFYENTISCFLKKINELFTDSWKHSYKYSPKISPESLMTFPNIFPGIIPRFCPGNIEGIFHYLEHFVVITFATTRKYLVEFLLKFCENLQN